MAPNNRAIRNRHPALRMDMKRSRNRHPALRMDVKRSMRKHNHFTDECMNSIWDGS